MVSKTARNMILCPFYTETLARAYTHTHTTHIHVWNNKSHIIGSHDATNQNLGHVSWLAWLSLTEDYPYTSGPDTHRK